MSKGKTNIDIDLTVMAVAILFICFYGEPDLIDAIIYFLMNQC